MTDSLEGAVRRGNIRTGGAALILLAYTLVHIAPIPTGPLIAEPLLVQVYSTAFFIVAMVTLVVPGSTMLANPGGAVRAGKAAREAFRKFKSPLPHRLVLAVIVGLIAMMGPLDTEVKPDESPEVSENGA